VGYMDDFKLPAWVGFDCVVVSGDDSEAGVAAKDGRVCPLCDGIPLVSAEDPDEGVLWMEIVEVGECAPCE